MPFLDQDKAEMEKTTKITTMEEARAAVSAIASLSHEDWNNSRYDHVREMQSVLDRRFAGSGFSVMYSQQEQMWILY